MWRSAWYGYQWCVRNASHFIVKNIKVKINSFVKVHSQKLVLKILASDKKLEKIVLSFIYMYYATFGSYENEGKLFLILLRLFLIEILHSPLNIQTWLSKIFNIECHYSNNIPLRYTSTSSHSHCYVKIVLNIDTIMLLQILLLSIKHILQPSFRSKRYIVDLQPEKIVLILGWMASGFSCV